MSAGISKALGSATDLNRKRGGVHTISLQRDPALPPYTRVLNTAFHLTLVENHVRETLSSHLPISPLAKLFKETDRCTFGCECPLLSVRDFLLRLLRTVLLVGGGVFYQVP